jgi:hypothetical protein
MIQIGPKRAMLIAHAVGTSVYANEVWRRFVRMPVTCRVHCLLTRQQHQGQFRVAIRWLV